MTNTSFIVALTGGIASGKSTVEQLFAELGVPIIDADKIARRVVEKGQPALNNLINHFGNTILNSEGELDRACLKKIIFNSPKEREWVNQLLHPIIQKETEKHFAVCQAPYLIWVVPLLIENNLHHIADQILVVESNPKLQLKRLIKRDNIDEKLAKNILLSQANNNIRRNYADDIINNNGQIDVLKNRVFELHQKYLSLAKNYNLNQSKLIL